MREIAPGASIHLARCSQESSAMARTEAGENQYLRDEKSEKSYHVKLKLSCMFEHTQSA